MISEAIIAKLANPLEQEFLAGLSQIASTPGIPGAQIFLAFVEAIEKGRLPERCKAERTRAILARLALDHEGLQAVAGQTSLFSRGVKNSVAARLPAQLRPLLLKSEPHSATDSLGLGISVSVDMPPASPESSEAAVTEEAYREGGYSIVLLAAKNDQSANKRLLSGHSFFPIQHQTFENLLVELKGEAEICGIIVDASFMTSMNITEQEHLIKTIADYSTFSWLRINDPGAEMNREQIQEIVRTTRGHQNAVASEALRLDDNPKISERELSDLASARRSLLTRHNGQFVPGELDAGEMHVLFAAAWCYIREYKFQGPVSIDAITVHFMPSGMSGAKMCRIKIDESDKYLVAKIGPEWLIKNEIKRYRTYIQEWDDKLRPRASFHGSVGVILFDIVADDAIGKDPAPVLSECLKGIWNAEVMGGDLSAEKNLRDAVIELSSQIARLNRKTPPRDAGDGGGNPIVTHIKRMATSSINWGMSDDYLITIDKALVRLGEFKHSATIHGDMHLGNVLLRRGRDPHVIDYAGSGPGHPCIDLVRLELALYLDCYKQMEDDTMYTDFQKSFSIELATEADLLKFYEPLYRSSLNRICLAGCLSARNAAIDVATSFGGSYRDYLAAKYLVAWQNLAMSGRNVSLGRGIIRALSSYIE